MTSPNQASVGNVNADIVPDLTGFKAALDAKLAKLRLDPAKVAATPDVSKFRAELKSKLDALTSLPKVKVGAAPDLSGFSRDLKAALTALPQVSAKVGATPDLTGFNAALKAALAAGKKINAKVGAEPALAGFNTALKTALAALPRVNTKVGATPDLAGFNTALKTALTALPKINAKVGLDPSTVGFQAKLRAALAALPNATVRINLSMPTATATGTRIGTAAAAAFVTAFRAAVAAAPLPIPGGGRGTAAAAGAGGAAGGAYAATFRAVVAEALRNLPEPTIGVASGPAEQAIRDIRNSLERLGNERIGVTITADQARREAERIRDDLIRLRAISPIDVDVEANARAAQLVLDNLERRLAEIGRDRTTNVRVNVNRGPLDGLQTALLGSTNRMQLLITAGLALGPAIVPAAAAAAAAIGAIGGAAVSAVAGLGVGVLAISGVVGAVQALNEARNEQAKIGATVAKQESQEESRADSIRSAVASLANTRAQAASQARQSANQIADSERNLAEAQKDYLRVQQDLNRARQEAADALEDLDSAVKNNALSIRQANLDLADAERALNAVRNLPVDNRARVEAQLAYDRAKQNLDDLTLRQGRLKEEQTASAKAGVEGSTQVVAAQEKIKDAQRRVQDAERAVTEARTAAAEQARQSAFSIAQAQQAVVAAQRSAATAAVAAAATAGGAMDELQRKMDGLSPAGQRFAQFIVDLQPELLTLRRNAEQALPGFQRGLETLLPTLPAVNDFIRRMGLGLGELGQDIGTTLSSNRLRPFFTYIDATAVPTMDTLTRSVGRLGIGLGNLIVAFGPSQRQIVGGLDDMSRRFEAFTARLDGNNSFQRFLDYAITRGPIVLRTLNDVGGSIIHILEAAAPAGDVVLTVLSGIARVINAIPTPVLTVLLSTMTALRVASLLAAIPVGTLATNLRNLVTGTTTARAAMTGFAGFLGGPWTIAIAAATIGIGAIIAKSAENRAEIDRLKSSMSSYADALKGGFTQESLNNAAAILKQDAALRGLVSAIDRAGISQKTLIDGLNGDREARKIVVDALNAQIEVEKKLQREARGSADYENAASLAHKKRAEELERMRIAFAKTNTANAEANELTRRWTEETNVAGGAVSVYGQKIAALERLLGTLSDKTATAKDVSEAFRRAIDDLTGSTINAIEAEERQTQANVDLRKALGESSAGFDLQSAKTDANRAAILRNRDALQAALLATREKMLADIAAGVSLDEAKAANERRIAEILKEIPASQRNTKAVQDLVAAYGTVPKEVATALKATGVDAVMQQLKTLKAAQLALDLNISGADAMARIESGNQYRVFAATGGPVHGPGGPTDDRVRAVLNTPGRDPIRYQLSPGEFIQPAASVDYYGQGFHEAIRRRAIPREALGVRYRAAGGPVEEWDFPVNTSGTYTPTLEQIRAQIAAKKAASSSDFGAGPGFPPWPSSPGASRGDSGVWRSIVALIKSTGPVSGSFGNAYRHGDPLWHGCVPMDTRILTRRGWITRDEIRVGDDETIGYNPATGKNEWTLIVDVVEYDDAELWTLENRWVKLEVTPGHKWLVDQQVTVQTETACTECGREFATGRGMTKHRADVHGVLTPRRERYEEQLVATSDFKQSTRIHLAKPADLGGQLPITDDEAELIGWIFGDGYMEPYGPTIVQSKPEEVQYLRAFMARFPHSVYRRPPTGRQNFEVLRFALTWDYWQDLLARSKASKAEALDFVLNLSVSQRQAFMRGFLSADGTRDPRTRNDRLGYSAAQVSGPVAEAIKVAAYLEGYRPDTKVTTKFDDARFGTQPIENIGLRTPIAKSRNLPVVSKRTADVWCPTTTLGTWTARQGEEIFLTGNSGRAVDWMGYQQDALAQFLAARNPLELIHRTGQRDYAYTRGRNRGSFNNQLMNEHKNHIHIAMAGGGLVQVPHRLYDTGGPLPPGLTLADNRTGGFEYVNTADEQRALVGAALSGGRAGVEMNIGEFHAHSNQSPDSIAKALYWESKIR